MKRWIATLMIAGTFAYGAVACGDDDNGAGPGRTDGGADGQTPGTDGGPGGNDSGRDTGTSQCTFAGYVINLINTQTTPTTVPATDLGDNCTPSTSQTDFQSLFP